MTANELIRVLMKKSGNTQADLAAKIDMKNQSNVSEALKRDIKASLLIRMIYALGYEIRIVQKDAGKNVKEYILLDGEAEK